MQYGIFSIHIGINVGAAIEQGEIDDEQVAARVMKLYEEGKLDLKKRLGDYIPWVNGTNKQDLLIEDILLHQAGLKSFIPFFRETMDTNSGVPFEQLYATGPFDEFNIRVADNF